MSAELENKSADKTFMFTVESASINGIQCKTSFAVEEQPGKKTDEKIMLHSGILKENDMEEYADIELTFCVYDSNKLGAEPVEETIHIYPYGEDEASVNGHNADPYYGMIVSAGKCAFSTMSWSDATFEENGITDVEKIEILLIAYDAEDFLGEKFVNEKITLTP